MVEVSEDASVVSARMEREMRQAREAYEASVAALRSSKQEGTTGLAVVEADQQVEEQQVGMPVSTEPVDAASSFRYGRMGVVAVIVLVLFWLWVQERSSRK